MAVSIQKDGEGFVVSVTVSKEDAGAVPSASGLLHDAHRQIAQQMGVESMAADADAQIARIQDCKKNCVALPS